MGNSATLLYLLSGLIGLVLAAFIFTPAVLLGTGPFWSAPNYPDMQQHLSAARYFLHDSWRFPLFLTKTIMPPDGVSVVFLDVNPLLALLAKIWFTLTGQSVNYFGPWIALCYALQGAAFLFLCRSLGLKGWLPAITCTVIALSVPEFLYRYFHLNLLGQFLITVQLGLYFHAVRRGRAWALPWAMVLALATILIHFYLFAMVAGIYVAMLADEGDRSDEGLLPVVIRLGIFAVGTALLLVVSGYLHGAGGSSGFGFFSMNILSPFVPQHSGLFGRDMIDATGGQYEGFNYLGAGVLLLFVVALALYWRELGDLARGHKYLLLVMVLFTGFAISLKPFIGDLDLFHPFAHPAQPVVASNAAPVAHAVATQPVGIGAKIHDLIFYPLQQFRSSGRFFWPVGYLMAACGIVGVWRRLSPSYAYGLLAVAAALQFVDAAPLRADMATAFRDPGMPPVGADPWVKMIAAHKSISVLPTMDCAEAESPLIPLFVYYASESVTPTHSAKLSRGPKADCQAEMDAIAHRRIGLDEIVVMLAPPIAPETVQGMPDAALCRKFSLGFVCSHKWDDLEAAGIKLTDRDLGPPGPMPYNPAGESAGHRVRK